MLWQRQRCAATAQGFFYQQAQRCRATAHRFNQEAPGALACWLTLDGFQCGVLALIPIVDGFKGGQHHALAVACTARTAGTSGCTLSKAPDRRSRAGGTHGSWPGANCGDPTEVPLALPAAQRCSATLLCHYPRCCDTAAVALATASQRRPLALSAHLSPGAAGRTWLAGG